MVTRSILSSADKEHFGAFIVSFSTFAKLQFVLTAMQRDERVIVVWTDNFDTYL